LHFAIKLVKANIIEILDYPNKESPQEVLETESFIKIIKCVTQKIFKFLFRLSNELNVKSESRISWDVFCNCLNLFR